MRSSASETGLKCSVLYYFSESPEYYEMKNSDWPIERYVMLIKPCHVI